VHEKAPRRSVSSRYALGQGDYDAHVLTPEESRDMAQQPDREFASDAHELIGCDEGVASLTQS